MSTTGLSPQAAGAITIALIVGLGIFVYPWLLAQRYGAWIVGLTTILLGALFVGFQGSGSSAFRWLLQRVGAGSGDRRRHCFSNSAKELKSIESAYRCTNIVCPDGGIRVVGEPATCGSVA